MHAHGQLNRSDRSRRKLSTISDGQRRSPASGVRVLADQAATPEDQQVFVRYFESEIEVVEENNEFLRVRHKATQRLLEIPRSAAADDRGEAPLF